MGPSILPTRNPSTTTMAQNSTCATGEGPSSPTRTLTPAYTLLPGSHQQHRFPKLKGGGSRIFSCPPPPLPKLHSWFSSCLPLSLHVTRSIPKTTSSGPSSPTDIVTNCLIGFAYCSHPYCTTSTTYLSPSSGHQDPSVKIPTHQSSSCPPRSTSPSTSQVVVTVPASSNWASCSNNLTSSTTVSVEAIAPLSEVLPLTCPLYTASSIYTYSTGKHKCPDDFFPNCNVCGSCRHCCHTRLTQLLPTPQRCIPLHWVEPALQNGARSYPTNNILCSHPLTNTTGKYCCSSCVHPCTTCDSCCLCCQCPNPDNDLAETTVFLCDDLYLLAHTHKYTHQCIIWDFYKDRCRPCDIVPWGTWETHSETSTTSTHNNSSSTYVDDTMLSSDSDNGDDNASWESSDSGRYHPPLVLPYPSSDTLAIVFLWWQDHMWLIVNCIFYNDYKYHPLDIEHWLGIHGHSMDDPTHKGFLTQSTSRMQDLLDALYMDASACDPEYTICYGHVRELMTEFHFQLLRMHYLLTHLWPKKCPPDLDHDEPHCLPFSTPHTTPLTYTNVWPRKCSDYNHRVFKDPHTPNTDIFNFTTHPGDLRLSIQALHAPDITSAFIQPSIFEYLCTPAFRAKASGWYKDGEDSDSSLSPSTKGHAAAAPALAILYQLHDSSYREESTHSWSISSYSREDSDDDWSTFGGYDSDDIYRRQARGILGVQKHIPYTPPPTNVSPSFSSPTPHNTHNYTRDGELLLYARMISCERYNAQFQLNFNTPYLPSPPLRLHNHTYQPSLTPTVKYRGPRHYARCHIQLIPQPIAPYQSLLHINPLTRGVPLVPRLRRRLRIPTGTASLRGPSHTPILFSRLIPPSPFLKRVFLPSRHSLNMHPHKKLSSPPGHPRKHSLTCPLYYSLWFILILLTSHLLQHFCPRSLTTRVIATTITPYNIVPARNHSTTITIPFALNMHSLFPLLCPHIHTYRHVLLQRFLRPACRLAIASSSFVFFSLPPCYNPRRQSQWLRTLFEYVLYYPP